MVFRLLLELATGTVGYFCSTIFEECTFSGIISSVFEIVTVTIGKFLDFNLIGLINPGDRRTCCTSLGA